MGPHAAGWFGVVTREAMSPASRVYGLAGLYAVDRPAFDSAITRLGPVQLDDNVMVLDSEYPVTILRMQALLPDLRSGLLSRIYADTTPRGEC